VNELQLHSRLGDPADDLAPGGDPYGMVAGARALHRRRRRTRIGVAGAALAVAIVAVGVPTVVGTVSTPDRGDVAVPGPTLPTPTLPFEGPPGAADELAPRAEAVAAGLARAGLDEVPDPEQAQPCPDAAEALSAATGMVGFHDGGINAGGGTLTGCRWSDDTTGSEPAEQRLDLSLRADWEATTDGVLRSLDEAVAENRCSWTTLPGIDRFVPLSVCEGGQTTWNVTILDEDGEGAWVVSSAVGTELPEQFGLGSSTVVALWDAVSTVLPDDDRQISPVNRAFNDVVNGFDARSRPVRLSAPSRPMSCPELPTALADVTGTEPVWIQGPGSSLTCTWDSGSGSSLSMGFVEGATPRVYRDAPDVTFEDVPGSDSAGTCLGVVLPSTEPAAGLAACGLTDHEQWRLDIADAGGRGVWTIGLRLPTAGRSDSADAVRALVELADARW
jgi:hypothetical protein